MRRIKAMLLCLAMSALLISTAPALATEDQFFQDGLIEEITEGRPLDRDLLGGHLLELGADFRADLGLSLVFMEDMSHSTSAGIRSTLSVDIRPGEDIRVFAKGYAELKAGTGQDGISPTFGLTELFLDTVIADKVFIRLGKHTVNWGVGYFMSPSDIINTGRIDPQDPNAQREGPVSLRINVPIRSHNLYLYALASEPLFLEGMALAPKAEFVIGKTELGLGGFVKQGKAPRAMATLSTSAGKTAVFGEAVISRGSDKKFIVADPLSPFGIAVIDRDDEVFFSGTLGFRRTFRDDTGILNLTLAGQYLYNGEGYADPGILSSNPMAIGFFLNQGQLSLSDLASPGRHYGAASAMWSKILRSDFSAMALWLGNMSDGSGLGTISLSWSPLSYLTGSIGLSRTYGNAGTEYAIQGPTTMAHARLSIRTDGFYWRVSR